jgi:hypothetical protein
MVSKLALVRFGSEVGEPQWMLSDEGYIGAASRYGVDRRQEWRITTHWHMTTRLPILTDLHVTYHLLFRTSLLETSLLEHRDPQYCYGHGFVMSYSRSTCRQVQGQLYADPEDGWLSF